MASDDPSTEANATPITAWAILAAWANAQDNWARALVAEIASTRKELSEPRIDAYYDQLLREKELKEGERPSVAPLNTVMDAAPDETPLTLTAITDTQNVNALASGQEIVFNPRMTILFGENATGKTGYVRILKRIAGVRSAEAILPDIWKTSPDPQPRATIKYSLGGPELVQAWKDEPGLLPFTRINVFDARGTAIHVDEELTYTYTPAEVSLFPLIHAAIERVRSKLDEAKTAAQPKGNPFTARIPRDPRVYPKIESLGPATDTGELKTLAAVVPEEEAGLSSLRDKVEALSGKTAESRLQLARSDRDLYERGRLLAGVIERFDVTGYGKALDALRDARTRHSDSTKKVFAKDTIPGAMSPTWLTFIEAADRYLREVQKADYPTNHDQCIYCRQALNAESVALLKRYREFCGATSKAPIEAHKKALSAAVAQLQGFDLKHLDEQVQKRLSTFSNPAERPDALMRLAELCARAKTLQDAAVSEAAIADTGLAAFARETAVLITESVKKIDTLTADLAKQADERKRALETESAKLRELEARLALKALLPEILKYVEDSKWASKATTILARFKALAKSLTESAKQASERLLNTNFGTLFQRECQLLAAPKVSLEFPGKKGQPARRKSLTAQHRLSDVLSEGEQKALALADFLAEALLRAKPSPLVFDDPVNSLDYKRLQHVVDRLYELSKTRQVIVFTHNIWFTMELLSRYEDEASSCAYYDVSESNGVRGVISRGTHPRADTLKALKGKINKLIQDSGPLTGEAQSAVIEKCYEYLRSYCEVLVEEELLQSVTKRYQPNVMMTRLPKIKGDRLANAIATVLPVFEKACRYIASHSQPLETLNVRPGLTDLKADWKSVLDAQEAYAKT